MTRRLRSSCINCSFSVSVSRVTIEAENGLLENGLENLAENINIKGKLEMKKKEF